MANPNEERNDQGTTPDQGFNTIRNSSIEIREKKTTRRNYTFLGIIALTALLIVTLLVTAIGGIIANVANQSEDPGESDHAIAWTKISLSDADTQTGPLILVNATHEYTFPADNSHLDLIYAVRAQHKPVPYQLGLSSYMERTALSAMDKMLSDFHAASGKSDVLVRYAYRNQDEQSQYGSEPVGFSDFHTGFGCDLKFLSGGKQYELSSDPAYDWIKTNITKYGFVVRYPDAKAEITGVSDYESYFRYVGVAHASYMTEKDLCLEEYIEELKGYTQKKPLSVTAADGKTYEIYYAEVKGKTDVKVPENFNYTLSGTNDGGVVVTVNRSDALTPAESDTTTGTDTTAPDTTTANTAAG